jgi:alkylation response protein AidB-like acyl-CoA dehydrogenase
VSLRSPARFSETARRLVELYRSSGSLDPRLRDEVTGAWMQAEGYRLHTYMTVSRMLEGEAIGAEASLNKIFWSEMDLHLHTTALELLGPTAELLPDAPDVVAGGRWLDGYLFSLSGPIYAGTNEIQRNIIADRVLKLPRGA